MLALGINGSPRPKGNTAYFINKALEGFAAEGGETRFMHLRSMQISPCIGCMACKKDAACAIKDDMYRYYELTGQVDALIIGTPMYFDHITSWLKGFLERFYCYMGPKAENWYPRPQTKVGLILTYEWDQPMVYTPVVEWLKAYFKNYWSIETLAALQVDSCPEQLEAPNKTEALAQAYAMGQQLAAASR
ncbi:MAG: flavodoxin family protein [Anaerolineae bacterium]